MSTRKFFAWMLLLMTSLPLKSEHPLVSAYQNPALKRLYEQIEQLLKENYPEASLYWLENKIYFEYKAQPHIIPTFYKGGEFQGYRVERGPYDSGIIGEIKLSGGPYLGAASVTRLFENPSFRSFSTYLMAHGSEKDGMCACIYPPRILDRNFLRIS